LANQTKSRLSLNPYLQLVLIFILDHSKRKSTGFSTMNCPTNKPKTLPCILEVLEQTFFHLVTKLNTLRLPWQGELLPLGQSRSYRHPSTIYKTGTPWNTPQASRRHNLAATLALLIFLTHCALHPSKNCSLLFYADNDSFSDCFHRFTTK